MTSSTESPEWGPNLQIVFSVLIGVSFAQAFTILGQSHFELSQLLLVATVFYVVFDCWYGLNRELTHLLVARGRDIALYLAALVCYSCLPFLYFAHTATTPSFGAAEFLTANLSIICIFDAVRRNVVFLRNGNKTPADEKRWHKRNNYLVITGYAYGVILALGTLLFASSNLSTDLRAGIILVVWLIFRGVDYIMIEKLLRKDSPNDPSTATSS
jgi:hypothetical protein